jgi:small conductance mechanosensitive channel
MPDIVADTFLHRHSHQLTAVLSVVGALLLAALVDRALARRGRRLAAAVTGGRLSPVADTRLRFLRRVIDAVIIVVGVAIALAQFTALDRLAATILASSAIAAAVVGFAARQTLANAIAGLFLAITQPLRIGDLVTFEGETGTVEDVRLTYTYLRTGTDVRVIIPNERLAGGVLRNESIVSTSVAVEASVWLAPDAHVPRALRALRDALGGASVRIAEVRPEGTRVAVTGDPAPPGERAAREAELCEAALDALYTAGAR